MTQVGAPKGNRNNMRHGLYGSKLPAGCSYIRRECDLFRAEVEDLVLILRGEIGLADAATINTAWRWERHARLCQRWLVEADELSHADRISYSREIARASTERDKCLKSLGLDAGQRNALDALYSSPVVSDSPTNDLTTEGEQDDDSG